MIEIDYQVTVTCDHGGCSNFILYQGYESPRETENLTEWKAHLKLLGWSHKNSQHLCAKHTEETQQEG